MANLEIKGYTVIHLDTTLNPSIQHFTGESKKFLSLNCKSMTSPDNSEGILAFDISIEVHLPNDQDSKQQDPILVTNAQFMFSFAPDEAVSESQLTELTTTTGVQIAIPIMRSILAGTGNILNHPEVYDFPTFKPDMIKWQSEDEAE